MDSQDLLTLYGSDAFVQIVGSEISSHSILQIEGLSAGVDAVVVASLFRREPKPTLIILPEKEDAAYFLHDLVQVLGDDHVRFYPSSAKRPYEYQQVDNANIVQRAEVLSELTEKTWQGIIVSYPEALQEKVVNRQTLLANTLTIKSGSTGDLGFLSEWLISFGFDKTDFVYEPGQFSVRGGILDVYSYAQEYPYRLEFLGDEIETIRHFNPETQLSIQVLPQAAIVPDITQKMTREERASFFSFLPESSHIWIHNLSSTLDSISAGFSRWQEQFDRTIQATDVAIILPPSEIAETPQEFESHLIKRRIIEFGTRFHFKNAHRIAYRTQVQPSFNKKFELVLDDLLKRQGEGFTTFICAENPKQLNRLQRIFQELDPLLRFQSLPISLRQGFIDPQTQILVYTDHQIFDRFHRYKLKESYSKSKALTLKEIQSMQPGDYVTHIDHGVGRFAGMETLDVNGKKQEAIRLIYRDNDILYVNIHSLHKIAKFTGKDGTPPTMSKLGSGDWENKKSRVKRQVRDIAKELIELYAKRRAAPGFAFQADSYLQIELESSFFYEDTPDQAKATADIKADMEKGYPMDRLVCGDVGFGKTEVAIRAAFKAVADSKQVGVLVPTTILAMQHFKTFVERLGQFPVTIDYINRFKTTQEISSTLKAVKEGKVDILIGTHRILNKDVEFRDLGLLIIDEEQKFGVKAKDRIKEMKLNVDVLTLTATPIPRTLHFSLMGARDLSVIATPPPNRQPVTTEVKVFTEETIRDAIRYELRRGGQVYFVHNRVQDIESIANIILRLVPDARIGVAHGQMEGPKLEKIMMRFMEGELDILISTNIIESGLDIPNANTIIINHAHMFGMSDLHQMRGRVGRSNKKAFCFLLTPPMSALTREARKRLQTLEEFSDLGDGFKVAMRDLDIRGAGNLLGAEQSGFVNDLGFEMYHKVLDEAVQELKETDFKDLFAADLQNQELVVKDCQIETDLQILIPDTYISHITERLSIYNEIDRLATEEELNKFRRNLEDRFGKIPPEVVRLFKIVELRWKAEMLGFEKVTLKNNILKGFFVSTQQERFFASEKFGQILDFVKANPKVCQLKQAKDKLIFVAESLTSITAADQLFQRILGK